MICKYCGQPIEDGKSFCTSCGAFNESSSETEQKKPRARGRRKTP